MEDKYITLNEYQQWTFQRLVDGFDNKETQFIGLASELGELMSERMRELRHDREALGSEEVLSELGDIMFYLCNIAYLYGHTATDVIEYNMYKLTNRTGKVH